MKIVVKDPALVKRMIPQKPVEPAKEIGTVNEKTDNSVLINQLLEQNKTLQLALIEAQATKRVDVVAKIARDEEGRMSMIYITKKV